jgi:hypothetical protein
MYIVGKYKIDLHLLNIEESPYVARIFLPRAIYENVDIVFIEIYGIH